VTVLRNNFDGGPSGTTVTIANSGQVPGNNAFDDVVGTGVSGALFRYSATPARPTAEFSVETKTGATSAGPKAIWNTAMGLQTQIWYRFYFYYSTLPPAPGNWIWRAENSVVPASCAITGVDGATLTLYIANSTATVKTYSTAVVLQNTWMRVEGRVQFSTTTGNADLWFYQDADSDTVTDTVSVTGQNFGASSADYFEYGVTGNVANSPQTFFSGVALSSEGPIGPAPFRLGKGAPAGNLSTPTAVHDSLG
jgi:hypothetical protein